MTDAVRDSRIPYPARIAFNVGEPARSHVLAAANVLGLAVEHYPGDAFVVVVPDPYAAYELGRLSAE